MDKKERARDPLGQRSVYIPPGDSYQETYRLSTFLRFPDQIPVSPRQLASAGFLYTGYKDRVKCFSCGLCVGNWVVGDDVRSQRWHRSDCAHMRMCRNVSFSHGLASNLNLRDSDQSEHRRHFPNCNFRVQNSKPQNVPLTPDDRAAISGQAPTFNVPRNLPNAGQRDLESMFPFEYPVSAHMRNEDSRLQTFDERWSANNVQATPQQISRGGNWHLLFWHLLWLVVVNWDPHNEPWTEHSKWFPNCEFSMRSKGHDVHQTVSASQPQLRSPFDGPPTHPPQETLSKGQEQMSVPMQSDAVEKTNNQDENKLLKNKKSWNFEFGIIPYESQRIFLESLNLREAFEREKSFEHWPISSVDARSLAANGFFYLGNLDRMQCSECGTVVENWSHNGDFQAKHKAGNPNCRILGSLRSQDGNSEPNATHTTHAPCNPDDRQQNHNHQGNQSDQSTSLEDILKLWRSLGLESNKIQYLLNCYLDRFGELDFIPEGEINYCFDEVTRPRQGQQKRRMEEIDQNVTKKKQKKNPTVPFIVGGVHIGDMKVKQENNNEQSKTEDVLRLREERICKVCLEMPTAMVFVPCRHLVSCEKCGKNLRFCPFCGKVITMAFKISTSI